MFRQESAIVLGVEVVCNGMRCGGLTKICAFGVCFFFFAKLKKNSLQRQKSRFAHKYFR